jgi:hypothetical protein
MSKLGAIGLTAALLSALTPSLAADETAADNLSLRNFPIYWIQDRPSQDDFLPPESGPGPVVSEPGHPYVPNGAGKQQTNRLADLNNPALKDWVKVPMGKANDEVREGKIPFIARERCWPTGVPGWLVFAHAAGMWVVQTDKEILFVQELDQQTRHIYMNVPHSAHPKPSWYGESVGHFEDGELVVDTIGMNDKSFVDNYRTPHTDQIHVVERFKMVDGGKALQVTATVDDPGAYNMAWSAVQRWKRGPERQVLEQICAENSEEFYNYSVVPMPQTKTPDF